MAAITSRVGKSSLSIPMRGLKFLVKSTNLCSKANAALFNNLLHTTSQIANSLRPRWCYSCSLLVEDDGVGLARCLHVGPAPVNISLQATPNLSRALSPLLGKLDNNRPPTCQSLLTHETLPVCSDCALPVHVVTVASALRLEGGLLVPTHLKSPPKQPI